MPEVPQICDEATVLIDYVMNVITISSEMKKSFLT